MNGNFAAEFYGLPSYFITNARTEAVGQNIRVYHWEKRGGILAPRFMAVVSAVDLVTITRDVRETAARTLLQRMPVGEMAH